MTSTEFLNHATRILFFTGKGGVGKTSLACATAIALASRGAKVLLVSTDPASNLDEVLGVSLCGDPTPVPGAVGLWALNIDPEAAAKAYRERVVGPYRGVLPESAILSMEEQLSGACTVEIAAFDEFTKLLGDPSATAAYRHVIFDTAPTGHTLRLLKLPGAWTGFIATNTTGTSCLGPLAGLQSQRAMYEASLHALSDETVSTLAIVCRPELSALKEGQRTASELAQMGVQNQCLVVNGIFTAIDRSDPVAMALESRGRIALEQMPEGIAALPRLEVPLLSFAPMGVPGLRAVFAAVGENRKDIPLANAPTPPVDLPVTELIDQIEAAGRGVVMTMGKGGVGKTTVASAIAVELARRGHLVHLSTTDPAAHVAETLCASVDRLTVSRIDPVAEVAKYTREVMAKAAPTLDADGLALLEEDLRSPCTEEIAVFSAFAHTVEQGRDQFVVLDTAPTGHSLLLLDAAESYHRDVARTNSDLPEAVRQLLPRLRDPGFTRVILVTLPEATPVHEAARLQDDLARAGIQPFAWIINQCFSAVALRDPALQERASREMPFIAEVVDQLASRTALIPWTIEPPVGPEKLLALIECGDLADRPV